MPSLIELPEPDAAARAHSEHVLELVRARSAAAPLSFADYMSLVLYAPALGYYMAGATKFGDAGDFVTAPEMTPWFGRCLGRQCEQMLEDLGATTVMEFGAGTGAMAEAVLRSLPAIDYVIVEPSGDLRDRQHRRLDAAGLGTRTRWVETPPMDFRGVVVANEVLDALPVERFFIDEDGRARRVMVDVGADGPTERPVAADGRVADTIAGLAAAVGGFAPGYRSEFCPWVGPWLATLDDHVDAAGILLIDYGYPRRDYYHPDRHVGTLRCHYRHRAHDDPYQWPGLQDITAHVDFTLVAEEAVRRGFELLGYTTQASFLLSLGLLDAMGEIEAADTRTRLETSQAIGRLILPGGMGERVQVLALGKGYDAAPRGFATLDLSHRL